MGLSDKVKLIPRELKSDERGWFLKVITGNEENLPLWTGEVYVTMGHPGQVRGNHYHIQTNEWFTVIQGTAVAVAADPLTGERREWTLDGKDPATLYIPAGIAHAFKNPAGSQNSMLLIAYADQKFQPLDTIQFNLVS